MNPLGLIATLTIHLGLLFLLLFQWEREPPKKPPMTGESNEPAVVRLLPITDVVMTQALLDQQATMAIAAAKKAVCRDRKSSYVGIGVLWQFGSGLVLEAPPGFPAHRAGVRKGDVIVNPFFEPDRRGMIHVIIERDGKTFNFWIKPDKICFEEEPSPKRSMNN